MSLLWEVTVLGRDEPPPSASYRPARWVVMVRSRWSGDVGSADSPNLSTALMKARGRVRTRRHKRFEAWRARRLGWDGGGSR